MMPDQARAYLDDRGFRNDRLIEYARLRFEGGRIVFPWIDADGNEVYETGRSINGQTPKYLNLAGKERPPLFATPGAWQASRVALCEGQIDALLAAQGGTAAFATCGQSLPDEAIEIVASKDQVILVPDADERGGQWRARAIDSLARRVDLFEATVPDGFKDLGEVAERADDPDEAIAEILARATPIDVPSRAIELDLDFLREPLKPPEYMVDPYLIAGEIVNLTSIWGAGKTWLALDLSLSIADESRSDWLGMAVAHGPVVHVDEESSIDVIHERLLMLGADPDRLRGRLHYFLNQSFRLDEEDWIGELHRLADRIKPRLFVFDSFARFHSLDENSSGDMARLYDIGIKPLSRTYGAAVVLLDHPPKDSIGRTKDPAQATRGSGDKIAQVDRGWLLRKQTADALSLEHMKSRRGAMPPSILIRREVDGERVRHINEGEGGIEASQVQGDVLQIVDFVREAGGSARRKEIEAMLGGEERRTTRALDWGITANLLAKRREGREMIYEAGV